MQWIGSLKHCKFKWLPALDRAGWIRPKAGTGWVEIPDQELFHQNPGPGAKGGVLPLPSSRRKSQDATFPCMGKEPLNIAH